jgi:hypothetical protein
VDHHRLEHVFTAETADAEAIELRTLAEAKRRPDWPLWEKAIEEELGTLKKAGTWRLEKAPPGANIIGSKWVFKAKKDAGRTTRRSRRSPRCRRGGCSLGAPRVLRARRDVPAFGRSARATHDAQFALRGSFFGRRPPHPPQVRVCNTRRGRRMSDGRRWRRPS